MAYRKIYGRVPVVFVENSVLWANRAHGLPFKFSVGKPLRLSLFASPHPPKKHATLEGLPEHHRTGVVGRALFKARGGLYRDLDAKGIGCIFCEKSGQGRPTADVVAPYSHGTDEIHTRGVLAKADADAERKNSLAFLKAGIRTALPVAEIRLEQLVNAEGKQVSIKEARASQMLHPATKQPVVLLRAFGTKFRVKDVEHKNLSCGERRAMIHDAKNIVSKELGRKLTDAEYAEWFATNLGEQVARMHNKGWVDTYLSSHNLTLDGRIVDLDGVKKSKSRSEREADFTETRSTLVRFITGCKEAGINVDLKKLLSRFTNAYDQKYYGRPRKSLQLLV